MCIIEIVKGEFSALEQVATSQKNPLQQDANKENFKCKFKFQEKNLQIQKKIALLF